MIDDLITPIRRTDIGESFVSTIYMANTREWLEKQGSEPLKSLIAELEKDLYEAFLAGEEWKLPEASEDEEDWRWSCLGPYYETMVFGPSPFDQWQIRHRSITEAMQCHDELVKQMQSWHDTQPNPTKE